MFIQIAKNMVLILLIVAFISCKEDNSTNSVTVSNRKILLNGSPYTIKGICYHPVPKDDTQRNFKTLKKDIDLMREAGINTIRTYAPIKEKEVLDQIAKAGIKVIIGFGYDQKGVFDIQSKTYKEYINIYKEHPAILMWELGNEYNYHPEWFDGDIENWYTEMDNAASAIKQMDKNHPVSTAHGELPNEEVLNACPNIDVWGMNVYRWDNPEPIFNQWKSKSSKPMYISEAGADSYMTIDKEGFKKGNNQDAQAKANNKILEKIFNKKEVCIGVTMFSFTDGWWKAGNPSIQDIGGWAPNSSGVPYDGSPNEEFWGIVDIDRNKKKTFNVIKNQYQLN